jgi:dihydropteroate synthase
VSITACRSKRFEIKARSFTLRLSERTHVMGILNRTPDSFSDGGRFMDENSALTQIRRMAREGADIIDVGGESARPGSLSVSLQEELDRTIPIVAKASRELEIPISIDTSKHEVALEAIRAGASMVNDITGLKRDPHMARALSDSDVAVCVMHMKGTPRNMQDNPVYEDLMGEILAGLQESIAIALKAGISSEKIIIDPGIGFGKTVEHNLAIIQRLKELTVLHKPILIGTSRKSFIGNVLGKDVSDRIMGTAATCALAIMNGADIIRVHDVKEMVEAARLADAVKRA